MLYHNNFKLLRVILTMRKMMEHHDGSALIWLMVIMTIMGTVSSLAANEKSGDSPSSNSPSEKSDLKEHDPAVGKVRYAIKKYGDKGGQGGRSPPGKDEADGIASFLELMVEHSFPSRKEPIEGWFRIGPDGLLVEAPGEQGFYVTTHPSTEPDSPSSLGTPDRNGNTESLDHNEDVHGNDKSHLGMDAGLNVASKHGKGGDDESEDVDDDSQAGDHESKEAGDKNSKIGDHDSKFGNHNSKVGNHNSKVGDHNSKIGDHDSSVGDYDRKVGNHDSKVGDHDSKVGNHGSKDGDDDYEDEDDDEKAEPDLGLVSSVNDETDDIGPPQFKPLEREKKPYQPNKSSFKPDAKPEPLKSSERESERLAPSLEHALSKPTTPEEDSDMSNLGSMLGLQDIFGSGSSGNPGAGDNEPSNRPRTPSGKPVGRSKGKQKVVVDGVERTVTNWELNAREILEMKAKPQGEMNMLGKFSTDPIGASSLATYEGPTKHIELFSFYESVYKNKWNDELWNLQWYMHDYRTKDMPVMDMNVVPAWELGYTGKNIKIAVVDDGIMRGHPDLAPNHLNDWDYDYAKNRADAQPEEPLSEHSHGTKCASQISMVAGNGLCGVGMAYDAKLTGVRNNVGKLTYEFVEGQTLTHRLKDIDISTNSYGPKDDGIFMQRAPHLTYEAFSKGVTEGRGGRGQVYVFPSGNGRKETGDHCGADCYMNTRYTIGISAANQVGKVSEYSERCAGILAAAYSSGGPPDERVVTVEMANNCNDTFGGTSAAVPHATAVIALVLQANPNLTYRDVMHIITMGTEVAPLADNENTWRRNGAGFWVSHDFGFGLLNAKNMVLLAKNWKHVHVEHNSCDKKFPITSGVPLSTGKTISVEVETDGCPGKHSVQWIENVELEVTIEYPYRGALSISLTSPYGTVSELLETREKDNENGMRKWIFRTVHHWGETPNGRWVLSVTGNALEGLPAISGSLDEAIISFHGMARDPPHQSDLPRTYAAFRLPDGQSSQDKFVKPERPIQDNLVTSGSSSEDEQEKHGSSSEDELEKHGKSDQDKKLKRKNSSQGKKANRARSEKPDQRF